MIVGYKKESGSKTAVLSVKMGTPKSCSFLGKMRRSGACGDFLHKKSE